ncbi:probable ubiquitin-conjugating enzyme E2 26 [Hibiscus syriacus]|uniref:probable ubiquitin-conjugating enzyme E2 26 n=1 Tax=Hibiscus syriacus TaxID=106335 RepID=UPI0019236889|nr:probable ubiquitin-conjugating enzyme E2 26 [Hibiscus syriacus]
MGARNTPYHNGLFFFDLEFPSDYPNRPPSVRYRSFGLTLNPNLCRDGYVCFSLLNTWTGEQTERWDPNKSTVLQGLVLNEKPYYNEPGPKPAPSWKAYNADVFPLSCKTMLFLLNKPLRNFEEFIAAHFKEHGSVILRACIAYRHRRVSIGFFDVDDGRITSDEKIKVSKKFKKSMDQLYPKLYKAFDGIGASLNNLPETMVEVEEKRPSGIISKLKKFWKAIKN